MKTRKEIISLVSIFAFLLLNAFMCSNSSGNGRENDPLPDKRPSALSIILNSGGGMLYYSEDLYISADSCYFRVNDGGAISKFNFKITGDEFDKLYKVFTDNRFDEIKTHEEMIYDRGGESIRLSWGKGKYAEISNAGMSLIKDSWQKEWAACLKALDEIKTAQTQKQKKDYEIRIDKSFSGKNVSLYVKFTPVVPNDKPLIVDGDYFSKFIQLTPGSHRATFSWGLNHYNTFTINSDSTKGILLEMKNDSLKTTFLK